MLLDIDFNVVKKEARGTSSFNVKSVHDIPHFENKFRSSSFIERGVMDSKNHDKNNKNFSLQQAIKYENNNINSHPLSQNDLKNHYSTVEKAINSLDQVDLNGVLESINFDNKSQNINKTEFSSQVNLSISSDNSPNFTNTNSQPLNKSYDYPANLSKNKLSENFIPTTDLTVSSASKINSTNFFNFNENLLRNIEIPVPAGKNNYDISNFENLLQIGTSKDEDKFDKSLIRKQVRGVIIV
jgi:hypothetical protein